MIRWPFHRRVTKTVTPTVPDVTDAASALARHRAAAHRALVLDRVRAMRETFNLGDKVRVL